MIRSSLIKHRFNGYFLPCAISKGAFRHILNEYQMVDFFCIAQ
jgi:hypothetical protein